MGPPPMTREERAAEWRGMAAHLLELGNAPLARQAMLMARQIENTPTTLDEMFSDLFKGIAT